MQDLYKFGTPLYWVDETTHKILQYAYQKPERDTGLFVPTQYVSMYLKQPSLESMGQTFLQVKNLVRS